MRLTDGRLGFMPPIFGPVQGPPRRSPGYGFGPDAAYEQMMNPTFAQKAVQSIKR